MCFVFFFQAEDGIRDGHVTGVQTCALPICLAGVWQERTATPSRCTVQAPQRPAPQPNLVPVICSCSRMTHKSGVSSAVSTCRDCPLTMSVIMFPPWLMPRSPDATARIGHDGFLRDAARTLRSVFLLLLMGDLGPAAARPSREAGSIVSYPARRATSSRNFGRPLTGALS